MTVFFTADTHFSHRRIIDYCKRPYASSDEMNADLVARWNAVVAPDDEVWHLGDFSFHDGAAMFERLHGCKHLIVGNHDHNPVTTLPWLSQREYHEIKLTEAGKSVRVVLFHYPIAEWNRSRHGALHLHGHTHGNLPNVAGRCDVGVDCWAMQPVSLQQITARLDTLNA